MVFKGFEVPRRQNFPRPLGDNSPYTPPDPEPGPAYKPPSAEDYRLARQRWEQTGELAALWDMLDNVAERPWPSPKPSPAMGIMQAAVLNLWSADAITSAGQAATKIAHRKFLRQAAVSFVLVVSGVIFMLIGLGVLR